jgi:drug/metabolite transporter (DMT)-like permease
MGCGWPEARDRRRAQHQPASAAHETLTEASGEEQETRMTPPLDARPDTNHHADGPDADGGGEDVAPAAVAMAAPTAIAPTTGSAAVSFQAGANPARWWRDSSANLRGSILLLAAIVSFTAMTILIKVAGQRIPLVEILTIRQVVMQILIAPFFIADFPQVLRTRHPMLQVTRGLLQLGAMMLTFAAVIYLPLAISTMISFSYALFVTIGAGLLLKENVGLGRWLTTAVGLVGVAVMLRPMGEASLFYSLIAVLGAVLAAGSAISLRLVPGAERADTILTYQALVLLAALAVPTFLVWVTPTSEELVVLLLIGVSGTFGQWLLTVAYKTGEAAALAPLDFVRLLLTVLCGLVLFGETLDIWEIVGGAILIGAAANAFRINARGKAPVADRSSAD